MDITYDFEVYANDYQNAGNASSEIKKYLMQIGFTTKFIRKIVICAYEAEMNIVIHSLGGKLTITIDNKKISLTSTDKGPGIKDLDLALSEGYSTATEAVREMGFGAGMGLPNMKKNCKFFEIDSSSKGTIVKLSWEIKDETFS